MQRLRMLIGSSSDEANKSVALESASSGRHHHQHQHQRAGALKMDFISAEDKMPLPRRARGGRNGGGRGIGLTRRMFRRIKSEPAILKRAAATKASDLSSSSRPFSDCTQSTLSLSLTSRGGDQSQVFSVRASNVSRLRKSDVLHEFPLEESEHSEPLLDEVVHPPVFAREALLPAQLQQEQQQQQLQHAQQQKQQHERQKEQLQQEDDDEDEKQVERLEQSEQLSEGSPDSRGDTITKQGAQSLLVNTNDNPNYLLERHEHPELGYMKFEYTDIAEACEYAKTVQKPVFVLYTELPGDEDVGQDIFSHPVVVEAIRTYFVAVLRVEDVDPNTPVRRASSGRRCRATIAIMDATSRAPIVGESLCGDTLTRECVLRALIEALETAGKSAVPKYLQILHKGETTAGDEKLLVLGTQDPNSCEIEFASLEGVVSVRSALWDRQRVCLVKYNLRRTTYSILVRHALHTGLCQTIFHQVNEERIASQIEVLRLDALSRAPALLPLQDAKATKFEKDIFSKGALRKTAMRFVPLTEMQSMLANRLIHLGKFNEAMHLLSPCQGQILMKAMRSVSTHETFYDVVDVPILVAWRSVCEHVHPSLLEPKPQREEEVFYYDSESDDGFDL